MNNYLHYILRIDLFVLMVAMPCMIKTAILLDIGFLITFPIKMRSQKVSVDIWKMMSSSISYLFLAVLVWIFLRLVSACFYLPRYLKEKEEKVLKAEQQKKKEEVSIEWESKKEL